MSRPDETLVVGRVVGVFGVRGWVKIESYTDPRENIANYGPWRIRRGAGEERLLTPEAVQPRGKGLVARLAGVDSREQAEALLYGEIRIRREQLPELPPGEYYWRDLIGLAVVNRHGEVLGRVETLLETGANDVLVVREGEREMLIPYLPDRVIDSVDLESGRIHVDWSADWDRETGD